MKTASLSLARWRLAQLASHLVVALIALVVIGGATRVMEAGLACPDWPLCFGSFLPGQQMNVQVFLEWFHRLDAFVIGILFFIQFILSILWRSKLSKPFLWLYGFLLALILLQGSLGALTVFKLLPSLVVTAHLLLGLTLVAIMSGLSQALLRENDAPSPFWWSFLSRGSLVLILGQSVLGGRMATTWAAQRCLSAGQSCQWLYFHRSFSLIVAFFIGTFVITAFCSGGWCRRQWPFLLSISVLIFFQIGLGILSIQFSLKEPIFTIGHQLTASLLVAVLSALAMRRPETLEVNGSNIFQKPRLGACHG